MDRVDAMKKLQGWSDTSVLHFRNLAIFGEQLLLSIRYGDWSDVNDPAAGRELGALLAAGDPGLHPRLSRRHRRRSSVADVATPRSMRRCRRCCCSGAWRCNSAARDRKETVHELEIMPFEPTIGLCRSRRRPTRANTKSRTPRARRPPPRFVKNFSGPAAECVSALARAGKTACAGAGHHQRADRRGDHDAAQGRRRPEARQAGKRRRPPRTCS